MALERPQLRPPPPDGQERTPRRRRPRSPRGEQLLQTFYPLHVGAVGGPLVKWLYLILGLAPSILSVTGTTIWYQRWRRTNVADSPDPDEIDTRAVQVPPRLKTITDANGAQRESPYVEPH